MKKKNNILILLLILLTPFIIKAEEEPSAEPVSYDVIVVEPKGIDTYTYEEERLGLYEHVDSGTIIIVQEEETIGKDKYLYGTIKDSPITIYVKSSDVRKLDEEFKTSDSIAKKADTKIAFKVATYKGVSVLAGPVEGYKEKGTLESGAVGTYEYYIPDTGYIYISSGELTGWVDGSDSQLYYKDRGSLITIEEIELTCAKIPPNTIIESPWYTEEKIGNVLLEYKNCSELWSYKDSKKVLPILDKAVKKYVQKETKLYNRIGGQSLLTIKEGTRIKVLSELYKNEQPIDRDKPASYYYVQIGDDKGWIEYTDGLLTDKLEEEEEVEPPKDIVDDSEEKLTDKEQALKEEAERQKKNREAVAAKKEKIKNTIVTCLVGGILLTLLAIVVAVLINKKKKKQPMQQQMQPVAGQQPQQGQQPMQQPVDGQQPVPQPAPPQEEIEVLDLNEKN